MLNRILGVLTLGLGLSVFAAEPSLYELKFTSSDGKAHSLSEYKGKVLLISNTASRCGYTGQYEDLQYLHKTYAKQGLVVLGFPSNSFKQELATDKEVTSFCKLKYDVNFPLSKIVAVKGDQQSPVFAFLTQKGPKDTQGEVSWNFEKFLVGRDGQVKARFRSDVEPKSAEFTKELTALLKQ